MSFSVTNVATMSDRAKRLSELEKIPRLARIDHRHLLDHSGKPIWQKNLSRKERRKMNAEAKKLVRKYKLILNGLASSGVGFPNDQITRQMAVEYTHRYAASGTGNQPLSFNYFEPFCHIKLIEGSVAPYVDILPETNHLFHVSDFVDFLTADDSDGFNIADLGQLPEAQTFHFSNNGDIEEMSFFDANGREYVFSGFSMVRRSGSIHWFLVSGEKLTSEEWKLRASDTKEVHLKDIPPWKRAFLRESMALSGSTHGAPFKLEGTESAIRTIVAGEFDIGGQKHFGKSLFVETENSFFAFADDPEILVGVSLDRAENIISTAVERLNQADILWNLAEGCFQLPQYFETRVTVPGNLVEAQGKRHGLKGKGGTGIKGDYVAIEAVSLEKENAPSAIRRVKMPFYSTETEGHWRRLELGKVGKDRDGNPVLGRTWVARPSPWRDSVRQNNVVFVKDSLAIAKARIKELYAKADTQEKHEEVSTHEGKGELYVLRCALMDEEVYKVGWTSRTANERARQLSSATGVPLAFVVVESWPHFDPKSLETEVHAQLAPYRINNQREFFRLGFNAIHKIIVQTIERVADNKASR